MVTEPTRPESNDELIVRYLEGAASAKDVAALTALLQSDPAARKRFVTLSLHDRCLAEIANAESGSTTTTPVRPAGPLAVSHRFTRRELAVAAAVLIGAAALALYAYVTSGTGARPASPQRTRPAIATLIESTDTVLFDNEVAYDGQQYPAGRVAIGSGNAEFLLTNGTRVRLVGPTTMMVRDSMTAAVEMGRVDFVCPHAAAGYTVHLPNDTRVIDLGTAFTVRVERPDTWVEVLDGAVRVERLSNEPVRLDAGMALAIGIDGLKPYVAGVVAEWTFDDATDALRNDSRHGDLTLRASGVGTGEAPVFDAESPALDGDGESADRGSMRFTHAGADGQPTRDGGLLIADDPDGALRLDAFTVEGYVRIDRHVDFAQIIGVDRSGGVSWSLDTGIDGTLRGRIDHQPTHVPGKPGTSGFNVEVKSTGSLEDGRWRHFAATWDSESRAFTLYVDHQPVGSRTIDGELVYDGGPLRIGNGGGGRALDGWLDHIRITRRVLEPDGFLPAPRRDPLPTTDSSIGD